MHTYESLAPESKAWVYQANRSLTEAEVIAIDEALARFTQAWVAHNVALKAFGKVYYNRFIVLLVDETQQQATGCSIDKSVKFLQELEDQLGLQLFDRLLLAYEMDGQVKTVHRNDLEEALQKGELQADTMVFNNLIQTKQAFENNWRIPFKDSWAAQLVAV